MSARSLAASLLFRTGGLRVLERTAKTYELASSGWPALRRSHSARFAILCYHRVGTGGIPFYSELPTREFERQMRLLRERYRVISFEQLLREIADPRSRESAVAITFDDGYRGTYTEAFPILKKYKIPALIYLTAGAIETGEPAWYDRVFLALQAASGDSLAFEPLPVVRFTGRESRIAAAVEMISAMRRMPDDQRRACCDALEKRVALPSRELEGRMLTWDMAREMKEAGFAFGAHTMSHPVLSRMKADDAERELRESKRLIEMRLGCPILDFAYPFGQPADCGEGSSEIIVRCGYRSAVTTTAGINRAGANPFSLQRPQLGQTGSIDLFAFDMNQTFLCPRIGSPDRPASRAATVLPASGPGDEAPRAMASEVKQDA